ncbi:hypothetical protein ACQ4LE_002934 [Meloidogyne hapla]
MSGSLSLKVVYNGKDVDTSGIKQLFSDGKDDMTLISTVPSVIKDQMPNDLKSALEKETIGDLKKEIGNTKNAIKESKTSKELKEKLEKVAPETKEVYDKTINWVYSKMGLDKQDEDFVEQLIDKISNTFYKVKEQTKENYQNMDSADKQNLTAFSGFFEFMFNGST